MARLKLWKDNDWKWHEFRLSGTDARNIGKEFSLSEAKCPVLKKHGHRFSLSFAFESEAELPDKKKADTICAVDIGVSNAAVCSIIRSDGTVTGRKFISFPGEEDRLNRIMNERRAAHSRSACRTHRLGRFLGNHNGNLARMTAAAIAEYASSEGASVIVGASQPRREDERLKEGAAAPLEEEGPPEAYGSHRPQEGHKVLDCVCRRDIEICIRWIRCSRKGQGQPFALHVQDG